MKIKYIFADDSISEVEVDAELGEIIAAMDKQEANLERKETRRHSQISALEQYRVEMPDQIDILEKLLAAEESESLDSAIKTLKPKQRTLLMKLYLYDESREEIAREEGVSQQAISSRLQTILKILKNLLEKSL